MKRSFFLLSIFLFLSFALAAQRTLSGLWTGTLTHDSATIRKDQSYELALTEYKGKVYGYCRRDFIINDTLYYMLKRVKGTIDGNACIVTDEEILSYNFPGKLDKGVKVTYTFHLGQQDSTWLLDGSWSTNKVRKKFYATSGQVSLSEEKDYDHSHIFPHLEELKLAGSVPFYAASRNPAQVVTTPVSPAMAQKPGKPAASTRPPVRKEAQAPPATTIPAAFVKERTTKELQTVWFRSDSLQLALYDNGEIDGDTVSVFLNEELIMPRQGLKETAVRKTIYLPPGTEEATLLLYAENLGKYPPNTGLLVVRDGDDVYQVRFSADLKENAAIRFRRKKP